MTACEDVSCSICCEGDTGAKVRATDDPAKLIAITMHARFKNMTVNGVLLTSEDLAGQGRKFCQGLAKMKPPRANRSVFRCA